MKLVFILMLLAREALVAITLDVELVVKPLDVGIAVSNNRPLSVQLCIKIGVLLPSVVVKSTLLVDVSPQSLDESDVSIHAAFIVLVHTSFLFIQSAEVLFEVQELVLQGSVVALLCSQFVGLGHQLGNQLLFSGSVLQLLSLLDLDLLRR
jgi:hypothetical protein